MASCCLALAIVCRTICWWPKCTPSKKPMARQTFLPADCSSRWAWIIFIPCNYLASSCGQCQKRDDALLQLRCSQLENIFEWNGIGGVKLARSYSSQRRQVRAAAQFFAKIVSEAAHIGPLRACNPKPAGRLLVSAEAEAVNMDQPRLPLHFQAFA